MHVDNELVEFVTVGEQEYEEVIEEYEEEVLVQEGVSEPSVADFADTSPTLGKPRFITSIFTTKYIYTWCAFKLQVFYKNYVHKYIHSWVLLV